MYAIWPTSSKISADWEWSSCEVASVKFSSRPREWTFASVKMEVADCGVATSSRHLPVCTAQQEKFSLGSAADRSPDSGLKGRAAAHVHGFPSDVNEKEVRRFFGGLSVLSVRLSRSSLRRQLSRRARVEFESPAHLNRALTFSGCTFRRGRYPIVVRVAETSTLSKSVGAQRSARTGAVCQGKEEAIVISANTTSPPEPRERASVQRRLASVEKTGKGEYNDLVKSEAIVGLRTNSEQSTANHDSDEMSCPDQGNETNFFPEGSKKDTLVWGSPYFMYQNLRLLPPSNAIRSTCPNCRYTGDMLLDMTDGKFTFLRIYFTVVIEGFN